MSAKDSADSLRKAVAAEVWRFGLALGTTSSPDEAHRLAAATTDRIRALLAALPQKEPHPEEISVSHSEPSSAPQDAGEREEAQVEGDGEIVAQRAKEGPPEGRERHITDWPCKKCGVMDLVQTDIGGGVYEDYRFRCNNCGHSWVEEGADA